jgi:hypothetical protein
VDNVYASPEEAGLRADRAIPEQYALDTFEHPFAYAAWRGVAYRLADRRDAA